MPLVFIIEDDEQIRSELTTLLKRNQYEVQWSTDFETIVETVLEAAPQLVLLDLNLPVIDGQLVCRGIRERSNVPIIVVTSRDSDLDELMSMNLGADDFITKPYSPQILLARIASLYRRAYDTDAASLLSCEGLELNIARSEASYQGRCVELTKNESRILQTLMQSPKSIISREAIQNALWQSDQFIDDNTLTVNINRLRATLESIGVKGFLHTKRGQGYYLERQ